MADIGSRKLKFGPNVANKLATIVTESFWAFFYISEIITIFGVKITIFWLFLAIFSIFFKLKLP
jgi:hypothetical protein